jgi:hypothetical protein
VCSSPCGDIFSSLSTLVPDHICNAFYGGSCGEKGMLFRNPMTYSILSFYRHSSLGGLMSSTQASCLEFRGCYFSQLLTEALHRQILSTISFVQRLDLPPNCTYRNWRKAQIPCKISTNNFARHALTSSLCPCTRPRGQIWV